MNFALRLSETTGKELKELAQKKMKSFHEPIYCHGCN